MRISDSKLIGEITALGVEHKADVSLAEKTSLGIGGTSDLLIVRRHETLPELVRLLKQAGVPHRFLTDYGHQEQHDEAIGLTPSAVRSRIEQLIHAK